MTYTPDWRVKGRCKSYNITFILTLYRDQDTPMTASAITAKLSCVLRTDNLQGEDTLPPDHHRHQQECSAAGAVGNSSSSSSSSSTSTIACSAYTDYSYWHSTFTEKSVIRLTITLMRECQPESRVDGARDALLRMSTS